MSGEGYRAIHARLVTDPRFWPLAAAVAELPVVSELPSPEELDRALSARAGVRFVRAAPKPRRRPRRSGEPRVPYDTRIDRDGEVPTRAGSVHDFMNALVWASFPRAKRALHARQRALVVPAERFESQRRPRTLDALALVDEGGVLLGPGPARPAIFGHAVYQGIALGWPDPLASALPLDLPDVPAATAALGALRSALDAALEALLLGGGVTDPDALGRVDVARLGDQEAGDKSPREGA